MKNKNKFTIGKDQLFKMEKDARREAEIEIGFIPTHKVHKSEKVYSRKIKHKGNYI